MNAIQDFIAYCEGLFPALERAGYDLSEGKRMLRDARDLADSIEPRLTPRQRALGLGEDHDDHRADYSDTERDAMERARLAS